MGEIFKVADQPYVSETFLDANRQQLRAKCEDCFGLCCVALPFAASVDFAVDKQAGSPCSNLQPDFRCGVHTRLRQLGFRGCTVYDCFGAGQKLSQHTYAGRDWRHAPQYAQQMFDVFPIMWQLHELLWYLTEALTLQAAHSIHATLRAALYETESFTNLDAEALGKLNVAAHRANVNALLLQASELARADAVRLNNSTKGHRKRTSYGRGADLIGAKLHKADLKGANLRGAYLIAADLREADLRWTDLIGADLRDTDLRGANLTTTIFLSQAQLNAAKGDASTQLPPHMNRPAHWTA
nr:pentapeptide repeat-containing protein [Paenibacillus taiwanensis]